VVIFLRFCQSLQATECHPNATVQPAVEIVLDRAKHDKSLAWAAFVLSTPAATSLSEVPLHCTLCTQRAMAYSD